MTTALLRCAALLLALVCGADVSHAQEPDALALAAPCREAGQHAQDSVDGTTSAAAYDAALAAMKASIDAFVAKAGEGEDVALHCLNAYGATLLRLGERAAASEVYRRAAAIARKVNGDDDDSTLTMQGNLAVALTGMGQLDEAKQLQEDTLARREALAGTPGAHKLAITLLNLAMVEATRGDLAPAKTHADRGWALAQTSLAATDRRMGAVLHDYAMVLDRVGQRSQAQRLFERALQARLARGDADGAIDSLASLAASFFDVGRFAEADQRYSEAYAIAEQALPPLHPVRGEIARSWCRILNQVGKIEESLRRCDEALELLSARGEQSRTDVYLTQVNRGITLGLLGRPAEAVESLRSAVRGLRETLPPNSPEVLEAVRALGVVLVDAGDLDGGSTLLATSYREQKALLGELHPDVLLAQGDYGVVLAMQGQLEQAERVLTDYASKGDTMRGLYGRDERTTRGVFSRFASTRMFLAKLLIVQGRCREAFDWIEATKGRALLDRLRERADIDAVAAADSQKFGALEQTRTRLFVERSRASGDGARQSDIDARLRAIDDEIGALVQAVRKSGAAARAQASPSQSVVRRNSAADTVLASYALADDEVLLVTYREARGFQCTTLERWQGLASTLSATRALQTAPSGLPGLMAGTATTSGKRLIRSGPRSFDLIERSADLPPGARVVASGAEVLDAAGQELLGWLVRQAAGARRLIMSLDGLLNIVAIDALPVQGRTLIERYAVSQVISFAEPATPRAPPPAQPDPGAPSMILFGDPAYGPSTASPSTAAAVRGAAALLRGALDDAAVTWPALPASAEEVRRLSSLYGLVPGKTLFTRDSANVSNLKALSATGRLGKARYVVFSAHAIADLVDPELSSVVLSRPAGAPPRDAYVTAADFATLRFGSELVFFSACETGYGQVVSGEGVLGLSAGALTAGARATVHTLWKVVDAASAEFTTRFFAAVRAGASPEVALANTKRSFMREPQHAAPAFWAAYVLVKASD